MASSIESTRQESASGRANRNPDGKINKMEGLPGRAVENCSWAGWPWKNGNFALVNGRRKK